MSSQMRRVQSPEAETSHGKGFRSVFLEGADGGGAFEGPKLDGVVLGGGEEGDTTEWTSQVCSWKERVGLEVGGRAMT
ncbi:hypothetical protein SESBI_50102 [Sesbania bispinosa]|nr:hypothetical protein SESBI_50102 [Sesbania bispinosa]